MLFEDLKAIFFLNVSLNTALALFEHVDSAKVVFGMFE